MTFGMNRTEPSHSAAITMFRNSQIAASTRWTLSLSPDASRGYAEVLAQSMNLPRSFPGVTLPGRADYLAALDKAVHEALEGKPASEALSAAAERWREITKKLDPLAFNVRTMPERLAKKGDLFARVFEERARLPQVG